MNHVLQIKLLDPRFGGEWPLPEYATASSAALDLRAAIDAPLTIAPGQAVTRDLRPDRINVHIDRDNTITSVGCG